MELVKIKNFDTLDKNIYSYVMQDSSNVECELTHNGLYKFTFKNGVKSNAFITIDRSINDVEIAFDLEELANVNVFILNEGTNAHVKEEHTLAAYSVLEIAYGDLDNTNSSHHCHYDLNGEEANIHVRMAYIGKDANKKLLNVRAEHKAIATTSNVEVYGVCKDKTEFMGDVVGHIENGAHQSYCTQATRVLNFDEEVKANVKPILLIDDNDVKASHACTMGTVDDAHLYYLESRGLTPKEAVSLIVSGYIAMLAQVFTDEELKERVLEIVNTKAGE